MDKVISAKVDESVARLINVVARRRRISKRQVLEEAVTAYAAETEAETQGDVFALSCGAWKRTESIAETVAEARSIFRKSMERRQR